jgi:FMN phosphatase YigB (HAD superfamily)
VVLQAQGLAVDRITTVFIDDGGVLNDNEARAPQWRRLLGEYLVPRLGGTAEAWARANIGAFDRSWKRYVEHVENAGDARGIERWVREERAVWLADMCAQVGVVVPSNASEYAIETGTWVSERVRSEIPGATDAVRWLHGRGLVLHTASGGLSWELEPYLRGMRILDRFDHLYGPDLVDRYKNGPHFYEAILEDAGVLPGEAAVVDDGDKVRGWAGSLGVRTFASLAALREALD